MVINFSSFAKVISKPVYALGALVVVLVTGSLFSHQVFGNAKPNDSLYIARIISEKAKLNTMFNSDDRNKLAVQFATEHAQDISAVLSNPEFNNDANKAEVAKLNASFNEEINNVKNRISYLSPKPAAVAPDVKATGTDTVSIADSGKDNKGLQLSETPNAKIATLSAATIATATPATSTIATSTDATADTMLDEAQKLFEKKDYSKAADKLKAVDELIK